MARNNLAARIAKLEAVRSPRPFVLIAATPEEVDRRLAEWRGGPVVIAPPVAATVEEWLERQADRRDQMGG